VHLDREQLTEQDEPGQDPEFGVSGAELAVGEDGKAKQRRDSRGAD
jgi:hypothetical protein